MVALDKKSVLLHRENLVPRGILILDRKNFNISEEDSAFFDVPFYDLAKNGNVYCVLPKLPLMPGNYSLNLFMNDGKESLDFVEQAFSLNVSEGDFYGTGKLNYYNRQGVFVQHTWFKTPDFLS